MSTFVAPRLALLVSAAALVAACSASDVSSVSRAPTARAVANDPGIASPGVAQVCIDPSSPPALYAITLSNPQNIQAGDIVSPSPLMINTSIPGPICANAIVRTVKVGGELASITMHASTVAKGVFSFTCVDDAGGQSCIPLSGENNATAGENGFHGSTVTFIFHPQEQEIPTPLFVIGDTELHGLGNSVNFWGAQWWKNNSMSGFVSNGVASFKGYATSADNFCGGHWTSSPGNSSNPPATLPGRITILVTSTVLKSGPDISGNIVQILKVDQDGGYGPNPGHPGNGTVVNLLCPLQ